MAFGKISNTSVSNEKVIYVGLAPVKLLAINPDKKQLEEIYGRPVEKEPVYLGSQTNAQGKDVPFIRLDFMVQTVEEPIVTTKITYFLRKEGRNNKDLTKIQVIDKYGRTAWVTKDEFTNHSIPMYSNGPANLDKDYRFIFNGEEYMMNFIKLFLGVPNVTKFLDGKPAGLIDNPQDAECRLDHVEDYFKGKIDELLEVQKLAPDNLIKVLFGAKHSDGGIFQDVYNRNFVSNRNNNPAKFFKEVQDAQGNGAYPNTIFHFGALKKYEAAEVTPTDFTEASADGGEIPFAVEAPAELPWS